MVLTHHASLSETVMSWDQHITDHSQSSINWSAVQVIRDMNTNALLAKLKDMKEDVPTGL